MGPHQDPLVPQIQLRNGPRRHQGRGEPSGEVTAAPVVLKAAVPDAGGQVGMARPGLLPEDVIIARMLVYVADQDAKRRSRGSPLKNAGKNLRPVRLPAGGGEVISARGATAKLSGNICFIHRNSRRHVRQHHADGRAVALAENRIGHGINSIPAPRAAKSRQKPG